jgi:hypothetical protein
VSARARWLILIAMGLAIAASAAFLTLAEQASLVVLKDAPVWDRPTTGDDGKEIAILRAGMRVHVTKCVDLKSYPVYRVRLPDGRAGYINMIDERLTVVPYFSAPFGNPLVFSCF